jgi:hypothetical protein
MSKTAIQTQVINPENNQYKFDFTQFKSESIAILGFSFATNNFDKISKGIVKLIFSNHIVDEYPVKLLYQIDKFIKSGTETFFKLNTEHQLFKKIPYLSHECQYSTDSYLTISPYDSNIQFNFPIKIYYHKTIYPNGTPDKTEPKFQYNSIKNCFITKLPRYSTFYTNKLKGFIITSKNPIEKIKLKYISSKNKDLHPDYEYLIDKFLITTNLNKFNLENKIYLDFENKMCGLDLETIILSNNKNYDHTINYTDIYDIVLELDNIQNNQYGIYPIYNNVIYYKNGFIIPAYTF